MSTTRMLEALLALRSTALRTWFENTHGQPTAIQCRAWPALAASRNALLIAPTGAGKTLAAVLPIFDQLLRATPRDDPRQRLQCIYVAPLRSLCRDVACNLDASIAGISTHTETPAPIRVAVRTGDSTPHARRKLLLSPPDLLVTTPESLSLLLSQPSWNDVWATVDHLIIDEIHELVPTKRGADLAVSLERLAERAEKDPQRIGLSATCRPVDVVARFLGGSDRKVSIIDSSDPADSDPLELRIESLLNPDEAEYRPLVYERLVRRIQQAIRGHRTTLVFANTRALTEKIAFDVGAADRRGRAAISTAAHHSAIDAVRRKAVERHLKSGELASVVTSTSLELGVDIGSLDLAVMVGPPPSVTRCLQRVGRSGHRRGEARKGLILAANEAELIAAVAVVDGARAGDCEPLRTVNAPLDVLCQQLLGMACAADLSIDATFALVRRAAPFSALSRDQLDDCVAFLTDSASERATAPRLLRDGDHLVVRSQRVKRWVWSNIGTITSQETALVTSRGTPIGTVEAAFADRLQPGDCFVLDGHALNVTHRDSAQIEVERRTGQALLPRWTTDRVGMSPALSRRVGALRTRLGQLLTQAGREHALDDLQHALGDEDAAISVLDLIDEQAARSVLPGDDEILIEHHTSISGYVFAFHAPLGRAACEALARATAARVGRIVGRNLSVTIADLGWSIVAPVEDGFDFDFFSLLDLQDFERDVLEGVDRGDLMGRQFQRVATTGLMVLRNPSGHRVRVGGQNWVANRLYPLVAARWPDHPLLRETRRSVLEDVLDCATARRFLESAPRVTVRALDEASPFARAWIDPGRDEGMGFESPRDALERLHARLCGPGSAAAC